MMRIERQRSVVYFGILLAVVLFWGLIIFLLSGCALSFDNAMRLRVGEKQVEENSEVSIQQKEIEVKKDVI